MDASVGIMIALMAGVFSFLSPCVLPLVPSYLSFVTGMTLEDLQGDVHRREVMTHATLFVAGFSGIFMLMGATASFIGAFLVTYEVWIARVGGAIVIVLGLHLMGVFRIGALMRERRVQVSNKPAGHVGTLAVGAAFGAGWTPCIGPQLGAIMTLAATKETVWHGVGLLGVYSIGLAVPFLLAALALDWFLETFQRFRRFIPVMEKAAGALLILLGLLLVTGNFTALTAYLVRFTPEFILERI